jgi:1,4-dihydroxy-2-naphthoate octaprenyltransferase
MPFFGTMLDWLLYSAIWIASCTLALCVESTLILQTRWPSWHILLFAWSSTFCHYNLHYFTREKHVTLSGRDRWTQAHRSWFLPAILISGGVSLYCLFHFSWMELAAVVILAAISMFYSLPLLPRGFRLKQLGVLKPFILAAVWAIITVWLPAHQADPLLLTLVVARRFVFMLVLCLAFDLRDQHKDSLQGIRTIPVRWGAPFTYRLMDVQLILFVVFAVLVEWQLNRWLILLALLASALLTKIAIRATSQFTSERYYLGVIDGMMMVQALFVELASLIHSQMLN